VLLIISPYFIYDCDKTSNIKKHDNYNDDSIVCGHLFFNYKCFTMSCVLGGSEFTVYLISGENHIMNSLIRILCIHLGYNVFMAQFSLLQVWHTVLCTNKQCILKTSKTETQLKASWYGFICIIQYNTYKYTQSIFAKDVIEIP
jgi:hypothetical protein